jgi:hypothetical protein
MQDLGGGNAHVEASQGPSARSHALGRRLSLARLYSVIIRRTSQRRRRAGAASSRAASAVHGADPAGDHAGAGTASHHARVGKLGRNRVLQRGTRRLQPARLPYLITTSILLAAGIATALLNLEPAAASGTSSIGGSRKAADCRREFLTHSPGWTLSGSWNSDGSELLLIDILHNKVLRSSDSGRSLGTLPDGIEATMERFFPSKIARLATGQSDAPEYAVELATGRIVTLDSGFAVRSTTDIFARAVKSNWNVRAIFLWHPAGADLITYSDLKDLSKKDEEQGAWKRAFLRIPLATPSDFSILQPPGNEFAIDYQEKEFYRLGNPYITSIGDTGYILRMKGEAPIYENVKGSNDLRELQAFRVQKPLPELTKFKTRADMAAVFDGVEHSSMPVGLFSWKQRLYVVSRIAADSGTLWQVTEIDPATDSFKGTATIRGILSPHLVIVPGPKEWAFIEKGHVYGFGQQETNSVFLVPTPRFEQELSGDICN